MKKIVGALYLFAIHFALILGLFSVLRIVFYLLNLSLFPDVQFINFLGGIRYDWMTGIMLYGPFLLLFPFLYHKKSKLLNVLFFISTVLVVIPNGIDFEYYKFTLKRTTADLFSTSGLAKDFSNVVGSFVIDYWYIIALAVLLIYLTYRLYLKIRSIQKEALSWKQKTIFIFIVYVFCGIGFRGGVQFRPLNVIHASQYASAQNIALVLNTPFTMIKSAHLKGLEAKNYFAEEKLDGIYNPQQHFEGDTLPKKLNVVLLIMESFSKEYVGYYHKDDPYSNTPFLDSIMKKSLVFDNAFANGKKSIESLPAILSGIPTLMDESYIGGNFGSNQIQSLASFLKQYGYSSSFYHGGENGTMGFEAFSQIAGIDDYLGRDQYPKDRDYDGNWGIFDEPFLQFCAEDMGNMQQPFFSTLFTLSSHHPYTVPTKHEDKFKDGPLPILKSIQYADYSLQQFFETIEQEDWFDQTLFIITADHTSHVYRAEYFNNMAYYRIPLVLYAPKYIKPRLKHRVVQQNDIFPSVVDFLGYEGDIVSFGNSFFSGKQPGFSISYLNGQYQFTRGNYFMLYDGTKTVALYDWKKDPMLKQDIKEKQKKRVKGMEQKLKGIIQQYNQRLINNQLIPS